MVEKLWGKVYKLFHVRQSPMVTPVRIGFRKLVNMINLTVSTNYKGWLLA